MADRELRTVILVPRRAGVADRDRLWEWCKERWQQHHPRWTIYEGHHDDGPFNRSVAINRAARLAGDWDFAIVIDADVFLRASQVEAAVERARSTGKVTWAHTRWRGLSEEWTRKVVNPKSPRDFGPEIADIDMDVLVEKTNPISWSCCIVVPRAVWDEWGGFDERFVGWGFEDHAARAVICGLFGHERLPGDVYHLWHERPFGAGRASKEGKGYTAEAITNARLGRRYMVAVLRDFGIGDQLGQEKMSAREAAVHIANLRKDDDKLAEDARRLKLPDWSDWWPTIPELVEGAKLYRRGSVTVIVHTGGELDKWPERKAYLEQSIPSLTENVTGSIVQRVIYDCWGDSAIRDWLSDKFGPLGYYVVGPEERPDFTGSMQAMWKYLSKRAKGDYIFAVEDDFIYERPVDLGEMIEVLRGNPHIFQVALLRNACYGDEADLEAIGNILGWPRPAFTFHEGWFSHRQFWTNNPSVFRKSLTDRPWPSGYHSETIFGKALLNDRAMQSAFWGTGDVWIRHIGEVRAGSGY